MSQSPVSARRVPIEISDGRFKAVVRPANYDEINKAQTASKSDKFGAHVRLFDAVNLERVELAATPRCFLGYQVTRISGGQSYANYIEEAEIPEGPAADAFVAKKEKEPNGGILAFRVSNENDVWYYLCREPEPHRFESYAKAQTNNGGGISADLQFVKQHCFFGDLELLKRECPLAISSLANAMAEVGGVCLEATLGEA